MARSRTQRLRRAWIHLASAYQWHPDATSYLARSGALSSNQAGRINDLVIGLCQDLRIQALASRFDAFWPMANETDLASRQNLVKAAFPLTASGTMAFAAKRGWTGDASTGHLTTGLLPSAATRLSLNAGSIGLYNRTNRTSSDTVCNMGAFDGANQTAIYCNFSAATIMPVNDAGADNVPATTSQGFWIGNRSGATAKQLYRNGAAIGASTDPATTAPAFEILIGALNNAGTPIFHTSDQHALAFVGGQFTAAEVARITARGERYMDALGAGVI